MRVQRFGAHAAAGPRGCAVFAVPFDPDQAWGAKAEHRAGGTISGRQVRGTIAPGGGGWTFTVTPMWMRDAGVAAGDDVLVELAPEGPQRGDPEAGPAGGAHRRGSRPARRRDQAAPTAVGTPGGRRWR
jgi:hypothetical protein